MLSGLGQLEEGDWVERFVLGVFDGGFEQVWVGGVWHSGTGKEGTAIALYYYAVVKRGGYWPVLGVDAAVGSLQELGSLLFDSDELGVPVLPLRLHCTSELVYNLKHLGVVLGRLRALRISD